MDGGWDTGGVCGLVGYVAHPTVGQAGVLDVNYAQVKHYPGTRPIALVNVR